MTVFERLRQLEANATPGPWLPQGGFIYVGSDKPETLASYVGRDEDAEFIVAARNLWGPLVDVAEAAKQIVAAADAMENGGRGCEPAQRMHLSMVKAEGELVAGAALDALERAVKEQP